MGPFNPKQPPSNTIDVHAAKHDEDYSKAKNQKDVQAADEQFLKGVEDHFIDGIQHNKHSDIYQSGIGWLGIKAKNAIEKVTGPLYPSVTGKHGSTI